VQRKNNPNAPSNSREAENTPFPRRELGRIVHDERGTASMEWVALSGERPRQVLEIVDDPGRGKPLTPRGASDPGGGFNPYASAVPDAPGGAAREAPRKPRDLRKLGEWMKMMRELEARKKRGED
jgi:hypothetical protein